MRTFIKNNKSRIINVIIFVAIIVVAASLGYFRQAKSPSEKPTENNETSNQGANLEGILKNPALLESQAASIGKGEVIFTAKTSTGKLSTLEEISVHNPHKSSWITVYQGNKLVSSLPIEIFKVTLAAITYDKIRVKLSGVTAELNQKIETKSGGLTTVDLNL